MISHNLPAILLVQPRLKDHYLLQQHPAMCDIVL